MRHSEFDALLRFSPAIFPTTFHLHYGIAFSNAIVSGSASIFWTHPVDVLAVVFDVTSFTVNAVLGVDHKFHAVGVFTGDVFVHTCWTEASLWTVKLFIVDLNRNIVVL